MEVTARRFVSAFNQRDLEALVRLSDAGIRWHPSAVVGTNRTYVGHDGLRRWLTDLDVARIQHRARVREVVILDEHRFAVLSEVFVNDQPLAASAMLATINEEGKIVEAHGYLTDEQLLTDLGLMPERDAHS